LHPPPVCFSLVQTFGSLAILNGAKSDAFEAGMYIAGIARCFGARAPVSDIARQILSEASLTWRPRYINGIKEGIDTSSIADSDFVQQLEVYNAEVAWLQIELQEEIDALDDLMTGLMIEAAEDDTYLGGLKSTCNHSPYYWCINCSLKKIGGLLVDVWQG
jgi:hypothetical protein